MDDKLRIDLEALMREDELYANPLTEKQRDILRAAERLFADQGYSDTPTAQIAKEAGVTEKTLFKHFPSKNDLLRRIMFPLILKVLVPHQFRIVREKLRAEHHTIDSFFRAIALDRWRMMRQLGPRVKIIVTEVLQNDHFRANVRKMFEENVGVELHAAIERQQAASNLRKDVPAAAIARLMMFVVAGTGVQRTVLDPDPNWDAEKDAELMSDLIRNGIGPRA